MGEYVIFEDRLVKLGTCEDLYYWRYGELVDQIAAGTLRQADYSLTPTDYLWCGYRFRFPWPDEDGEGPGHWGENYERGVLVPWPEGVAMESEHYNAYAVVKPRLPAPDYYSLEVALHCPQAEPVTEQYRNHRRPRVLSLEQQKPFEGALWAVVACPYCRAKWRLNLEEARALVAALETYRPDPGADYEELTRRLLAGYEHDVNADLARFGICPADGE